MNFHRLIITVFLLTIVLLMDKNLTAQKSNYLPENQMLSFNGTFQNKTTEDFRASSENGHYMVKYDIGSVSDEMRELKNLQVFRHEVLLFSLEKVPGSDIYISNSGRLAVLDMKYHFRQEITISFFDRNGKFNFKETYRYASLFGFSPSGEKFVIGTDKNFNIVNLTTQEISTLEPCSQFAFSADEQTIATAFEENLTIYRNNTEVAKFNTGFNYPRGIAISEDNQFIYAVDKLLLKGFSLTENKLVFTKELPEHFSFRDILTDENNQILAGVHYRFDGISKGILQVYTVDGTLNYQEELASKTYPVFSEKEKKEKSASNYETIPWPFVPFDQVHKVWNHYEQHMGDGSSDWAYLHQGLDIEVPINEPVYAVEEGWVKLVLTLGGDIYWRIAVCPEQVPGYADGWLYAHVVPSSIQVDVGDYVNLHDYLGDIIYWADDWGHIHFVQIHDQGTVWYYDDDEWGINFNPLLALDPITDEVAPEIQNFSGSSKFGFCTNETSTYLNPNDLFGGVDIIAKISDYHGGSEWEQPAFKTYYWLNKLPENTNVFPKTLGQILNHTYSFYESGWYVDYAPILYKKDFSHPSPPWMEYERDYFQILTNNNGDSIIELSELQLAFPTASYPDGPYRLFVEAWDEFGNMDIDSLDVTFDNFNTGLNENYLNEIIGTSCYPNPADQFSTIEFTLSPDFTGTVSISLLDATLREIKKLSIPKSVSGLNKTTINLEEITAGCFYYKIDTGKSAKFGQLIIR
jgi:murein DD-endopeptidase MepM/ murein hydrolase activator NlpD